MTKEELKQEAEEKCVCTNEAMRIMYGIGYIDGAEPREKRIQIDAEQIRALQKQNGELNDKVKELEAQLECERDLPAIAYIQGAEKQKKKDEEELKKWKDEWQEQVQKATDEGFARTLQTMQLSKAKELLKQWLQTSKASGCDNINIVSDTEQFISEVEK